MKKDHLEMLLEDIKEKFDLVLEGHDVLHREIKDTRQELREEIGLVNVKVDALSQKIDTVDKKVDAVEKRLSDKIDVVDKKLSEKIDAVDKKLSDKIDAVAADLAAHRADTEVHRVLYTVKE